MTGKKIVRDESSRQATSNGRKRRAEIVRRAGQLFQEMGYHNATMAKIADVAGIAKPTLYHYFRSKEDILFEIHLQNITPLIEAQQDRNDRKVSSTRVVFELIREHLYITATNPGSSQTFSSFQRELSPVRRQEMKQNRLQYRLLVEESFQRDIDEGILPPSSARTLAFSVFGMSNWAARSNPHLSIAEVNGLATEVWQLFIFGALRADRNEMDPEDFL